MIVDLLFYLGLALLLGHEMDAVHKHEWRLLFFLRTMPDERARDLFVLAHVPAVVILLWLLAHPAEATRLWTMVAMDAFLVIHAGLHWRLSDHPKYEFNTPVSRLLIYAAAAVGAAHLFLLV
jgi:hypothetical protein